MKDTVKSNDLICLSIPFAFGIWIDMIVSCGWYLLQSRNNRYIHLMEVIICCMPLNQPGPAHILDLYGYLPGCLRDHFAGVKYTKDGTKNAPMTLPPLFASSTHGKQHPPFLSGVYRGHWFSGYHFAIESPQCSCHEWMGYLPTNWQSYEIARRLLYFHKYAETRNNLKHIINTIRFLDNLVGNIIQNILMREHFHAPCTYKCTWRKLQY